MAAYCRICRERENEKNDTFVACNSCGSFACPDHYNFFPSTKDAICEICQVSKGAGLSGQLGDLTRNIDITQELISPVFTSLKNAITSDTVITQILGSDDLDNLTKLSKVLYQLEKIFRNEDDKGRGGNPEGAIRPSSPHVPQFPGSEGFFPGTTSEKPLKWQTTQDRQF